MEEKNEVQPIPADEFAASRPGSRTAALAILAVIAIIAIYYWPMVKLKLGL